MANGVHTITSRDARPLVVTRKAAAVSVATIVSVLVGIATLHGRWVLPSILAETRRETRDIVRDEVEAHETHPHKDAVHARDLKMVLDRINQLATHEGLKNLERQLDKIEARLRDIERGK